MGLNVQSVDSNAEKLSPEYSKIEIDSPECGRRFHIGFEVGGTIFDTVEVNCPHCGILLFEKSYHPAAALMREENLVKAPDGSRPIVENCKFAKSAGRKV